MRNAALMLLLLSSLSALAQPRATETIEVSVVSVDVVVTDRAGKRVTGLTAADFELVEAGKRQAITNFSEYRGAGSVAIAPPPASAKTTAEPAVAARPPRTIVVFVEWERLPAFNSKQIYDGIRDVLQKTVAKGDKVMIVSWAGKALIRQPFTDDVAQLETVLATMQSEHQKMRLTDIAADVQREQAAADQAAVEAATAQPGGVAADPSPWPARAKRRRERRCSRWMRRCASSRRSAPSPRRSRRSSTAWPRTKDAKC